MLNCNTMLPVARAAEAYSQLRPVMTIPETAEFFRASRGHIYNLLRRGDLLSVKVGGRTLVRRTDAEALIAKSAGAFRPGPKRKRRKMAFKAEVDIFG
ncbi:helix-turn-helix domain-containing protein [Rhizobium rhizosphaerae]|nr:helix-turn-helix domain-containing protein [Xaviernesmea rhizosphaerae]